MSTFFLIDPRFLRRLRDRRTAALIGINVDLCGLWLVVAITRKKTPMPIRAATSAIDPSPSLTLRRVGLQTYGEYVAFLRSACRAYKPESFVNINKIEIRGPQGRTIAAQGAASTPVSLGPHICDGDGS